MSDYDEGRCSDCKHIDVCHDAPDKYGHCTYIQSLKYKKGEQD